MKNKVLENILVYIVSPILAFSFINYVKIKYFIIVLVFFIVFYTIMNKKREGLINITGVVFSIAYIAFFTFRQSIQNGFQVYIVDTYSLILLITLIVALNLVDKSIAKQIYIDYLKINRLSSLNIWNIFKKTNLQYYLKKIELVVTLHLLTMVFIKVYSISTYGSENYKITIDLEILISVLFVVGEVYILSKFLFHPKNEDKEFKNNNINDKSPSRRVINLNQYKNINK